MMSGKYQAYPEYKYSGVEWLGDIPEHWECIKLKYVADLSGEKIEPEPHQKYVGMENVESWSGKYLQKDDANPEGLSTCFSEMDVLFGKLRPYLAKSWLASFSGICSSEFLVLKTHKVRPKFLNYYTLIEEFIETVDSSTYGSKMPRASWDFISLIGVPVPDDSESEKIANFLDHETAKIDTLIEKQQHLIKLLKEKRQTVISHAVTKGLNPDVPMRDSGVEWLGEVPEGWIVRRLKYTSKLQSGIPKGKDLTGKISINVPMLRVANVQDGYLNLDDVHEMPIEPDQLERYALKMGDVLMNEGGDNDKLGRGAVWQSEIKPCIHQNHVFAIRPYTIEPEWLDLVTRASYAKFHFFRVAKQSTNLASISSTNIKETPLVIPPENERQEIMKYILGRIDSFDKVEEKGMTQIALLKERRTSLISAAVTGKIDVRDWQSPQKLLASDHNEAVV